MTLSEPLKIVIDRSMTILLRVPILTFLRHCHWLVNDTFSASEKCHWPVNDDLLKVHLCLFVCFKWWLTDDQQFINWWSTDDQLIINSWSIDSKDIFVCLFVLFLADTLEWWLHDQQMINRWLTDDKQVRCVCLLVCLFVCWFG